VSMAQINTDKYGYPTGRDPCFVSYW
jgi:hypothetical protein